MSKTLSLLTALLFSTAIYSCAINEKNLKDTGAKLLGQQELFEIFKQDRVVSLSTKSGSADGYYFSDGTQEIKWPGGGDVGRYRIKNGQFCSKWNTTYNGKERCYRIYQTKENEYIWVKLDGSFDTKMIMKK